MAVRRRGFVTSLDRLKKVRRLVVDTKKWYLRRFWGLDIHPTCEISMSAKFDRTYSRGVHIGEYTYVALESRILSHDFTRGLSLHTRVGSNCFIGARATILPGVTIGSGSIVAAGAVVTKSCPEGSIVAGNPAKVIRSGIEVGRFGRFPEADETSRTIRRSVDY